MIGLGDFRISQCLKQREFCKFVTVKLYDDRFMANIISKNRHTAVEIIISGLLTYLMNHNVIFRIVVNLTFIVPLKNDNILCLHVYDKNFNTDGYTTTLNNVFAGAVDNLPINEAIIA